MSQQDVETVRMGFDAWNRGDMDAMLALLDEEFEYVTSGVVPGLAPVYRGHQGFRDFWRDFRETWETLRIAPHDVRDAGDQVVLLFTFHARGRDGLALRREFANVWTVRGGRAVRCQAYADWRGALEAAGLTE